MKKILTIVIPVYNTEKYIRRCLDSLLLKDIVDDLEIIVVNDGSKDNSVAIIKEYQKKYPNTVVLIDKKNGGHGSTINEGLKISSGEYFRVLDSDDWVNSEDFIKFVKRLKKVDADLVVTNYRKEHIYNEVSEYLTYESLKDNEKYIFDKINLNILKGEYFVMATSTYKTQLLKESNLTLFENTFYVDMQYNIVSMLKVKSFIFFDLDIYRYFIGRKDQSMNLDVFVKNQKHHEKVIKDIVETYTNIHKSISNNKREYYKIIIRYMLNTHYTIYCIYDKKRLRAFKEIRKFNNYLKEKNNELFNIINDIQYIKINRKIGFLPVLINGKLFSKLLFIAAKIIKKVIK